MSKSFEYLIYFCVYSLIILFIGKSSFSESDSVPKFFIGERKTGLMRLFFTFVGTWISAASILGFTGNVCQNGTAVIIVSVIPWFIGALMLYFIVDRLYEHNVLTIPQLIGEYYHSDFLQIGTGLLICVGYVLYLVIQIKGFGIAASSLLHIDYKVSVFLVYLFILYSTFGGFLSVSKTDGCNLVMLTVSVVLIYLTVIRQAGAGLVLSNQVVEQKLLEKGILEGAGYSPLGYTSPMYLTTFFGWGMGLAANPQYLIRLVAAKDRKTAKQMILYALAFLTVFYFCLTQIGLGISLIDPSLGADCETDNILIYAINHLLSSRFSGFFLISIIGSCISTANSQLLLVGSIMSYDVVGKLWKKNNSEDRILFLARWFIFLGGTASLLLSIDPPVDVLFFGADIWGVFAAVLTPLIYGMFLSKRGTRRGACGAFVVGVLSSVIFMQLELPVYWGFPATLCSCITYAALPVFEKEVVR